MSRSNSIYVFSDGTGIPISTFHKEFGKLVKMFVDYCLRMRYNEDGGRMDSPYTHGRVARGQDVRTRRAFPCDH